MQTDFKSGDAIHNCAPAPGNGAALTHLYVHIPFCARICPYCAFYKERGDSSQTQRFCEALLGELDQWRGRLPIALETIFIGGGTPTTLTTAQLEFLLGGFRDRLDLSALREWTVEANPGSVSARKAALLRSLGVNRISLGVQSWDDELLKLLGREHNAAQAEASFHLLRDAGFTNLNIDLMFGLPGQTLAQWEATLQKTIALGPEHISTYCLTYEEDTEFFARQARGEFREDPDSDARFLESAMRMLEKRRVRTLRDLKLRARRIRVIAQSRILGRRGLSGDRAERVFHGWFRAVSKRFRLPHLFGPDSGWRVSGQFNRNPDTSDEARRKNRAFVANAARNSIS